MFLKCIIWVQKIPTKQQNHMFWKKEDQERRRNIKVKLNFLKKNRKKEMSRSLLLKKDTKQL